MANFNKKVLTGSYLEKDFCIKHKVKKPKKGEKCRSCEGNKRARMINKSKRKGNIDY